MKLLFPHPLLLLLCLMLCGFKVFSQSPQAFKYQAIVRNTSGLIVANQNVNFRTSLLQGSATGTQVYSEEHSVTTNTFGLVNLEIGNGTNQTGTISTVDWSNGPYFIKIEIDVTGGSNFTDMGTTQLLSVPFALFAGNGDQPVSLTGTGATSVSGTYPNYTISSTDNNNTYTNGTGLLLNGNTFSASFGTTSGTISEGNHNHSSYGVGGSNGQIQFNNNNLFDGNTNLFWDNANSRLGIGTSNPTTALHINGTLRITDDSEGNGKVFTSDANGVGSWQTPLTPAIAISAGSSNYIPKFINANSLDNSLIYQNGNRIGVGTITPTGTMQLQQDTSALDTDPIFEIKDKAGQTVMVVYKDSVHFFVNDDTTGNKTFNRGSFAVSGKSDTKSLTNDFLRINADSTRIFTTDSVKGFGVRHIGVSNFSSYMQLTPNNYLIGHEAGKSLSSGLYNSFIGYKAGFNNSSGTKNYFIGYKAGYTNTSGYNNVFIGDSAGFSNNNGEKNVFIGNQAGVNNTWGNVNVFIGSSAGFLNTSGSSNTAVGESALHNNTTGQGLTAIGNNALYSNSTGWSSCAIGEGALRANTTGGANVAIGRWTLYNNTTGQNNTAIGNLAFFNGNYSNSTAIGFSATISASNQVKLGDLNITSLYCMGAYVGAVGTTNRDLYVDNNGKIGFLSSSEKYKKNISEMENINWLYKLRPVNYIYKNDSSNRKQYGLIAEDVEKINPVFVSYNPDGTIETVHYNSLITPMLKAIQDQKNKIEEQQNEIDQLKVILNEKNNNYEKLKAEIDKIKIMLETSQK